MNLLSPHAAFQHHAGTHQDGQGPLRQPWGFELRRASLSDIPAVRTVLAGALAEDPFLQWIFPGRDESRPSRIALYFSSAVERLVVSGTVHVAVAEEDTDLDGVIGAALWMTGAMGNKNLLPRPQDLAVVLCGAPMALRSGQAFAAAREGAPECSGPYLADLGVLEEWRGRGVGEALVRAGMAEVGTSVWAESLNPRNLPFYRRLGFEVVHQFGFADESTTYSRLVHRKDIEI